MARSVPRKRSDSVITARVPASLLRSFNPQALDPALLHQLKSTAAGLLFFEKYVDAVTHAVQTVFLVAVPIAAVAFIMSFFLPEVPLRRTVETSEVADAAVFLLSDAGRAVTAEIMMVDGGFHATGM